MERQQFQQVQDSPAAPWENKGTAKLEWRRSDIWRPRVVPGPTGERQAHLDAVISFAGAGQRRRLLRVLDILTVKWATRSLPDKFRFLLNTQLMSLKKEKDPTTKMFDDDERSRSLTEAQEITSDIPEERIAYDPEGVDPKKVRPILMGNMSRGVSLHSAKVKPQPSQQQCANLELALKEAPKLSPSSSSSSMMNGRQDPLSRRSACQNQS